MSPSRSQTVITRVRGQARPSSTACSSPSIQRLLSLPRIRFGIDLSTSRRAHGRSQYTPRARPPSASARPACTKNPSAGPDLPPTEPSPFVHLRNPL